MFWELSLIHAFTVSKWFRMVVILCFQLHFRRSIATNAVIGCYRFWCERFGCCRCCYLMWYSMARYVLTLRKKNIMCLPFAPHGNAWCTYFSYNKKLEHEINFQSHIVKIENARMAYEKLNDWKKSISFYILSNFKNSPSSTYNYGTTCGN